MEPNGNSHQPRIVLYQQSEPDECSRMDNRIGED